MPLDLQATRRNNLAVLLRERFAGKKVKLAEAVEVTPPYISQLLIGADGGRPFGEKTARSFERKLGLASGWFDVSDASPAPAGSLDARIKALPAGLRHALMEWLAAYEEAYRQAPWAYDEPVKSERWEAFHAHLAGIAAKLRRQGPVTER